MFGNFGDYSFTTMKKQQPLLYGSHILEYLEVFAFAELL